jgi:nicotinate dehydrogenase subunit B
MTMLDVPFSRRSILLGGGLTLAFSMGGSGALLAQEGQGESSQSKPGPKLPGSLNKAPFLDAWIRVDAQGLVTVFTGKAELGQGIKTALIQIAAEQLAVDPGHVSIVTADTARTANEGYTAGSHTMQDSGTAIMHAAAQVRELLIALAGQHLGSPIEGLRAERGSVMASDGRSVGFGALVADETLHVAAQPTSKLKDPASYAVMNTAVPRVDIPAKVTGGDAYVHDLRLPGMVHARVVRPPSYGATLKSLDSAAVERMPGVVKVLRDGNYLAVVAEKEYAAIQAHRALQRAAQWTETARLPDQAGIYDTLARLASNDTVIKQALTPAGAAVKTLSASFRRPYQLHGSIGPSCAVAQLVDGTLTVWSHAQGMFPLRQSIAEMLGMPETAVRCIHTEGAGCYGHNGADDAAADAALIARAVPGRPVRVQWMREQEHSCEPYGPVMTTQASASLDGDGTIVDWRYSVRSNTHSTRPPGAGQLMPAWSLATPFKPDPPAPLPQPEGGGDRNIVPLYTLPNILLVHQFVPEMPLRVSAQRGLGAYMNIFSIESFMDELAAAAEQDPVAFRLRHLQDQRGRDVVTTAAERFGWAAGARLPLGQGRGFAFARYKNLGAYAAIALEVAVDRDTGRIKVGRVTAAVDSGQAVNPDGIRNQIGGGVVQSLSWTLFEAVTYDRTRITSRDWSTYPILRFSSAPERVDVHVMDRPGQPFLGTGEAAQGPTAAALANAVAQATGVRIRELPFTPDRVRAAIGV